MIGNVLMTQRPQRSRGAGLQDPMSKPSTYWIAGVLTLVVASNALAQTNYLTDLGAVAPALAINNSGQVALQSYIYSNGTLTPYPAGFSPIGTPILTPVGGISSTGAIAGTSTANADAVAVYSGGTVTLLPTTFAVQAATNINTSGAVIGVGAEINGGSNPNGFVLSAGTATQLALPGVGCESGNPVIGPPGVGPGEALGINDAGEVVGFAPNYSNASDSACAQYAYLYANGTLTVIGQGIATAINANGAVTGETAPYSFAFLYVNGTLTTLPNAVGASGLEIGSPIIGYSINSGNYIVGIGCCNGTGSGVAFLYNGVSLDLNSFIQPSDPLQPYVTLTDAHGINDSGLVVINGSDSRTQTKHAYLLQVPLIQVTPGPLTLPSTPIGGTSAPMEATFTNTGTSSLALGTATITGPFAIQSNNCSASLSASAACTISVSFSPTSAGTPTGALTLPAANVPIAVPLAGSSPISVSLTSSAAKTIAGVPVTLTWSATTGASCTATGGASGDGWTGTLAASGTKSVSEVAARAYLYGITCTAGTETQSAQVEVTVSNPTVTAGITASPTTVASGASFTISWSSSYANSCASTGGGSNDGWPNASRPTSGSVTITEPNPVVAGGSEQLTFTVTCSSSLGPFSATASTKVTQLGPAASGGGGGEFDPASLLLVLGMIVLQERRRARKAIADGQRNARH